MASIFGAINKAVSAGSTAGAAATALMAEQRLFTCVVVEVTVGVSVTSLHVLTLQQTDNMAPLGLSFRIFGTIGLIALGAMSSLVDEHLDWDTDIEAISKRQGDYYSTQPSPGRGGIIDGPIPLLIALGVGGALAAFAIFQQANEARNNLLNQANTLSSSVNTADTNINALISSINTATISANSNLVRASVSCAANMAAGALCSAGLSGLRHGCSSGNGSHNRGCSDQAQTAIPTPTPRHLMGGGVSFGGTGKATDIASLSGVAKGDVVRPASENELLGVVLDDKLMSSPQEAIVAFVARQRASLVARLAQHMPRGEYLRPVDHRRKKPEGHVRIPNLLHLARLPSVNELPDKAMVIDNCRAFYSSDGKTPNWSNTSSVPFLPRRDVGGEENQAECVPRAIRPILSVEGSPRLHGHCMHSELIEAGQNCPLQ
eukprot:maker-scaffold1786_size28077-snap-gene-0.3 protein:Tk08063 transcript:maker-scaffold1786_size28077-snap-gene-0.3-mRNA-1 annotation:"PREDICTED: uncharacterized protein LOC103497257 isoform X1"